MVPRMSRPGDPVDRRGEVLRGARRGAQHDQVGRGLGRDQHLAAQPGQPALEGGELAASGRAVAAVAGHRVDQVPGRSADPQRADLDQVARQGALVDLDARRRPAGRPARPGTGPRCCSSSAMILACRAVLVSGARAGWSWSCARPARRARKISIAFCTCRRFSASSQTTDCGPSSTVGVDLLARGRPAGSAARSRPAARGQQLGGHRVRGEDRLPVAAVVLLAHRDPGVGGDHVAAPATASAAESVISTLPPDCRGQRSARATTSGSGWKPCRRGDPHVQAGQRAAQQVGVGHVVGPVAEVGQASARPAGRGARRTVCRSASTWHGW